MSRCIRHLTYFVLAGSDPLRAGGLRQQEVRRVPLLPEGLHGAHHQSGVE